MPFLRGTRYAVAAAGGGAVAAPSPLLTDLFAYYTLDEASGTAVDSLGSRNLTAFNSPVSTTGKIGDARAFVLASSQALKSAATDFSVAGDFTIAFWCNTTDTSVQPNLLGVGDSYDTLMVSHLAASSRIICYLGGLSNAAQSNAGLSSGNTGSVVITRTGSSLVVYLNGVAGTPATNSTTPAASYLDLGRSTFAHYGGWLDEVLVATRGWSQSDVNLFHNSGSGRTYPFA